MTNDDVSNMNFTKVSPVYACVTRVLPLVYDDTLSFMELLSKVTYKLNEVIENNNNLPEYIQELIKEYISSGEIEKVLADVLSNYMLNVKFPPAGLTPATGDGSADDTEAVQGCIDYAYANGGMAVYFPSGSYLVQPLTLKNKCTMFGYDRYNTRLVLKGGATQAMFTGNVDELTLTGMGFDGNMDIQVNNVNLFDITVGSAIVNNVVMTDGYDLFNVTVDRDLQISDVIFNHAVENALVVSGDGYVQGENLLFKSVSALVGKNFVVLNTSKSVLKMLKFEGATPVGVTVNGNYNIVKLWKGEAVVPYVDNGEGNSVEVYTDTDVEKWGGSVEHHIGGSYVQDVASNSTESVGGGKSETIGIDKTVTVGGNYKTDVSGSVTETTKGDKTDSVSGNRVETSGKNDSKTVGGNQTVDVVGSVTRTVGDGEKVDVTGNSDTTVGGVRRVIANSVEDEAQVTRDETTGGTKYETVKGKKIENVTGEKQVNVGGETFVSTGADSYEHMAGVSETVTGNKTVTVSGNYDESVQGEKAVNAENIVEMYDSKEETSSGNKTVTVATEQHNVINHNIVASQNITENANVSTQKYTGSASRVSNGANIIGGNPVRIESVNPAVYWNPSSFDQYFDKVTWESMEGESYNVLVANENTPQIYGNIQDIYSKIATLSVLPFADVRAFGCKGDGVTDDTTAFQNAVNSNNDVIYVPGGTYLLNSIKVPSNKTIVGGTGAIIKRLNEANAFINNSDGSVGGYNANHHIAIVGLTFHGNDERYSGVAFGHCENCYVIDCHFTHVGAWHNIEFNACRLCAIYNCTFSDYGLNPSLTSTEMIQFDFAGSSDLFPWFGPYDDTGCISNLVANCTFSNLAVSMAELSANPQRYSCIGNHTETGNVGSEACKELTVIGCNFINVGRCFSFCSCVGLTVVGCVMNQVVCGFWFFSQTDRSAYVTIMSNKMFGNSSGLISSQAERARGISTSAASADTIQYWDVIGNAIYNFYGHGIAINGSHVKIMNNVVRAGTATGQYDCYMGFDNNYFYYLHNFFGLKGAYYNHKTGSDNSNIVVAYNFGKFSVNSQLESDTILANNIFTSVSGTIGTACKILNELHNGSLVENQNV